MKFTYKIKTEIDKSYELELPYYCKSSTSYYKIIDENTAIKVEYWNSQYYCISVISPEIAVRFSDNTCDQSEFELAFQQVYSYINHKAHE